MDVCSMIPGAVWPAVPTARASQLLAIQFQLERSQWFSPDEILRNQKRQLWPLYCHAYERVPFYRQRMDAARLPPAQLTYYASYRCSNRDTRALLATGDGQCGAWASFLIDILRVQGINRMGEYVQATPDLATFVDPPLGFLVNNWNFPTTGTSGYPNYPYINISADGDELNASETGYEFLFYQEVTDLTGTPGQGNSNPASIFGNHQFVRFDIGGVERFFDPSYGVEYADQAAFDANLTGFYCQGLFDPTRLAAVMMKNPSGDNVSYAVSEPPPTP